MKREIKRLKREIKKLRGVKIVIIDGDEINLVGGDRITEGELERLKRTNEVIELRIERV